MANQAIALGVRTPQVDVLGPSIARNAQMMNMMAQQAAAQRQAAAAAQQMDFARNEEARKAALAKPQLDEATSKATAAQIKAANDFLDFSIEGMKLARNPEDAIKIGGWLKSQFPQPEFQQAVDQTLSSLPQDPGQFGAWREQTLFQSMDAKDQLEQHFNDVTTGRESWTTAAPKYAGSPMGNAAREVPGSRVQAAEDITYIKGENGEIIPMPKTLPGTGGPVGAGVSGAGSAAAALKTNPGALKDGGFARSQPGYTGNSGGFATFATPEDGIRAQENLLRTAYIGKGFNTIDKIVNRYAPQGPENSAASVTNYKKYIADRTGLDVNSPISASQVPAVAAAMREFETGNRPSGKVGGGIALGQPISTGPTKEQRTQQRGRDNVSNTVSTLRNLYAELRQRGGAVESGGGILAVRGNIANYIAGTAVGKPIGRALGSKEQATRDKIINVRRMLVTQIADAAGLSAQEMNSNVELQGLLDAATDPTQSMETVEATLNEIERLYGRPGSKPQRIGGRTKTAAQAPRRTAGGANVSDW